MEDAEALATVHVRSWQAAYARLIPQPYLDNLTVDASRVDRWRESLAATAWPSNGTLVAELDGRIVAFVGISPSRDNDQDSATVGEVPLIYALPEAWGRGIGRALMNSAIAALTDAGFTSAVLWVLDTNRRARVSTRPVPGDRTGPSSGRTGDSLSYKRFGTAATCPRPVPEYGLRKLRHGIQSGSSSSATRRGRWTIRLRAVLPQPSV